MKIPVLTYHSNNISGEAYAENDHVALASDLRTITDAGWRVVPLGMVVDWLQGDSPDWGPEPVLGLSFDDGSWFDFFDIEHPSCGIQSSFFNILKTFRRNDTTSSQPLLHASTFVITSPVAREQLDRTSLIGKGWWGEEWWLEAQQSGLMSVECHSWDHVHPGVDTVAQREQLKGDFSAVDCLADCQQQVARAGDYIAERLNGKRPALFAYPWGQSSAYLVGEYFPRYADEHGFRAAFNGDPVPVSRNMDCWALPRFICGRDWTSPEQLAGLLRDCL